jgi:hypothetical protein
MLLHLILSLGSLQPVSIANAQPPWTKNNVPPGYSLGYYDCCPHRTPAAVLQGKPRIDCTPSSSCRGASAPDKPVAYTTATPAQVIAALECDFADATQATRGRPNDLSGALITGNIKFAMVTKTSAGASLAVAAIPVFSAGSITPSVEASRLSEVTYSDEWTIKVDPKAVPACTSPSSNRWLTSRVALGGSMVQVERFVTKVSFVLTGKAGAGFKLNIVPISIGPQFSSENSKSQSLDLNINFRPPREAPAQPPIERRPN